MEPGTVVTVAPEALNTAQTVLLWVSAAVIAIVGSVGSALMLKGRNWLQAKTGIVLASDDEMKTWADHAIALAEEKSTALIKKGAQPLSGPVKLEEAMQFMIARVKASGRADVAASELRDWILARLGLARMSAAAAAQQPAGRMTPILIGRDPIPVDG
jgi:hypothetical protein